VFVYIDFVHLISILTVLKAVLPYKIHTFHDLLWWYLKFKKRDAICHNK